MKKYLFLLGLLFVGNTFAVNFSSKVDSKWDNGYCYKFYTQNDTSSAISNWNITFQTNSTIYSKRGGNFSCSNGNCKVTGLSRNDPIKVGQKFEVGFCANGTDLPKNVNFNGGDSNIQSSNSDENQNEVNQQPVDNQTTDNQTLTNVSSYKISKDGFVVDVQTQSKRDNGYCRKIIIKNTSSQKVSDWKLSFSLDKSLDSAWSANFSKNGNIYTITPKSWNKQLNPGGSTTIGFCVSTTKPDSNWKIVNVNFENLSPQPIENNTSEQNSSDETQQSNDNSTNTQDNSSLTFSIKPQGDLVASYPESQWPTYKASNLIMEINPWNIRYPADGYAKMYYDKVSGVVTYLQDLKNIQQLNPGGYVLGYPEVYVGNKPWNGNYVDAGSKLPAKIGDLKSLQVEASWKYEHPSDLSCNFAMEGWFTKNKFQNSGVGNGEVEMMIMWYRNIQGAAGSKVGTTTIPVELNGKTENITFDIYKANIGWDFVTFIPQNYKDFQNATVKFDILNFAKAAEKYVPQIKDLYLEDWEFGTEYGTPSTKQAQLAWQITKFKVTGTSNDSTISNETNQSEGNNNDTSSTQTANNVYGINDFYFAPYVDTTLYPFPLLSKISQQTNNYNYVLGFIVSNNRKCEASWGGYYDLQKGPDARIDGQHKYLYDEVNAVKNVGGKIMISFGGAAGTPLFQVCDENSLLNQYQAVIDKMGTTYLDFDIEGAAIANHQNVDKLIDTLVKLQGNNQNKLHIWFTLPVMPEGLTQNGLYLVQQAIKKGLIFDGVNLMTMDYGSSYDGNMANYAIQAVENTKKQIGDNISIGVTPMIGLNDITTENFTLEDAKTLSEYVKNNNLGRISYWSLNRDHSCSQASVSNTCSSLNNQTKDYEYLETFMDVLGLNVNAYQTQSITTTSADNYYKVESSQPENYEKLIPETYKTQIDAFFDKLKSLYSGEALQEKLQAINTKISFYLQSVQNDIVKAILSYILQKVNSF